MNLIELFETLIAPDVETGRVFNALTIRNHPHFRIAIGKEEFPILLLSTKALSYSSSLKNYQLKYLRLEQNIECKIIENQNISFQSFTAITFNSNDKSLQEYFFRVAETIIYTIGDNPTQQKVIDTLNKLIEVFRLLNEPPQKTVQGLWAELFIIDNSKSTKTLLNYWHSFPEEKFDFNAGIEKLEVKSSGNFERKHYFSSEQLNPPKDSQVLIASLFIRQNTSGSNIQNLFDSIVNKLGDDIGLIERVNGIVLKTLGNSFEHALQIRFDSQIARDSLLFYNHEDIKKIEKIDIPNEVSEVKYMSDLSEIKPINLKSLRPKYSLFESLI